MLRVSRERHRGKQSIGYHCRSTFAVDRHTRLRLGSPISSACPTTSDQHHQDGAAQAEPRHPRPATLCSPRLSHVISETTPERRGPSQLGDSVNSWKPEPANADARPRHCSARFPWRPPPSVGVNGVAALEDKQASERITTK